MHATTLQLDGTVLRPGADGYDDARRVWNARFDRRPALIARCRHARDVARAIRHARERGWPLAVRGGGHHIAGLASIEGGLLIDLSTMAQVDVDVGAGTVRVGGGAVWGQVDAATEPHGMAVPSGIISSTGVGGLTLGGGIGWLARRYGLTCDHVIEAELVDADGEIRRVAPDCDPELLWGLCGGGGNFGVVSAFTFRLRALAPQVTFGPTIYALRDARAVLQAYRELCLDAPRELCVWADLLHAPPLPFLPEPVHGQPVLSLLQYYLGAPEDAETALRPLARAATPLGSGRVPRPHSEAQGLFDAAYGHGLRNHWSAHNLAHLSDAVIDLIVDAAADLPTKSSDIMIHQLGGAIDDVAPDATAYPHRGVPFALTPGARWDSADDDPRCLAWVRALHAALAPHALGTAYVNFIAEAAGQAGSAYGAQLSRLRALKQARDPDDVFRATQRFRG